MAEHVIAGLRCSEASDLAAGFVLGALEQDQMTAVRAHLAACPEAHAEFAELGSALPALLESLEPAEPSTGLGGRILEAARRDAATRDAVAQAGATRAPVPVVRVAPVTPLDARPAPVAIRPTTHREMAGRPIPAASPRFGWSRPRPIWAAAGLAAVLAVVLLGAWNVQLRTTNDELAAYQQGVATVLDAAAREGAQLAVLAAPEGPTGAAGIAAVRPDGSVAIAIRGLAPTTGSQVYEAWLIATNASPVPIGGFRVGSTGSGALTTGQGSSTSGVVVALTLEPAPGATTPTLPIIVSGTAQPPAG